MNINTNNYKVVIDSEEYNLVSDEGEAHVLQAAALVDKLIATMSAQSKQKDKQKIAILVALQLASRCLQEEHLLKEQKKQESALVAALEQQLSSL